MNIMNEKFCSGMASLAVKILLSCGAAALIVGILLIKFPRVLLAILGAASALFGAYALFSTVKSLVTSRS